MTDNSSVVISILDVFGDELIKYNSPKSIMSLFIVIVFYFMSKHYVTRLFFYDFKINFST